MRTIFAESGRAYDRTFGELDGAHVSARQSAESTLIFWQPRLAQRTKSQQCKARCGRTLIFCNVAFAPAWPPKYYDHQKCVGRQTCRVRSKRAEFSEDATQTRLDGYKPLTTVNGTMRATQNCDPRGMQMSANWHCRPSVE